ncbi:hypothetical protein H9633_10175 [Microbacterium sp. Re1]|uniref:PhiRv1 phage protein n=1 Tax=Microbacterium commune TaxID=2762219 RepID=A0ABR8W6N8_9MICO|nr:hypothetical protein [Microbacterium commune]MBD8012663.1 hypothetical protein [Microbacterium commune]
MPSTEVKSLHGKKAAAIRWQKPVAEIERDLAAEKIAAYIEQVVSAAPPLTPSQRNRIAALIGGGA